MKDFEEREFLVEYWQDQYEEEEKREQKNDPVSETFRLVQFISRKEWGKEEKSQKK